MDQRLHLKLFGFPQITLQGKELTGFDSDKVRALLIYLSMTAAPQSRDHLAQLLWEDTPLTRRDNLRKAVSNLWKLLGDILVKDSNELISINQNYCWVDVHRFDGLYKSATVDEAVALYGAEFLSSFAIDGCELFEQWVIGERTRLELQILDLLHLRAAQYEKESNLVAAIHTLRRLLELDPCHENVHRWLMALLARNGQRSAALAQFDRCEQVIRETLDVPLSEETFDLYFKIKAGTLNGNGRLPVPLPNAQPALSPTITTHFVAGPPITHPHLFFGRALELARIFGWWQQTPLAHVTLIGPRRSGKTSLLRHLPVIATPPTPPLRATQRADWLPTPERYRWVWVDFQDPRMRRQERLLSHLLTGFGLTPPTPCSLENFMDVACSHPWPTPVIVLMDELGAGLAAPELDQSFWWALRALTQATDGQLAFAIAAHDSPLRLAEDQGKTSPFFNIFTTLALGPLTNSEVEELIASAPRSFADADHAWILSQSQGWPLLVQILCQERLVTLARGERGEGWRTTALQRLAPFDYLLGKAENSSPGTSRLANHLPGRFDGTVLSTKPTFPEDLPGNLLDFR